MTIRNASSASSRQSILGPFRESQSTRRRLLPDPSRRGFEDAHSIALADTASVCQLVHVHGVTREPRCQPFPALKWDIVEVWVLRAQDVLLDRPNQLKNAVGHELAVVSFVIDLSNHVLCASDDLHRSEERRVGKECRSRSSPYCVNND